MMWGRTMKNGDSLHIIRTYSYDLLLLLLLLVMMTMVHSQSGTVCLLLCVLLKLDGEVQNNFSGNLHTLNVTSSSTYYYFYCHLVLEARWRW